jgi:hypothetical protein
VPTEHLLPHAGDQCIALASSLDESTLRYTVPLRTSVLRITVSLDKHRRSPKLMPKSYVTDWYGERSSSP